MYYTNMRSQDVYEKAYWNRIGLYTAYIWSLGYGLHRFGLIHDLALPILIAGIMAGLLAALLGLKWRTQQTAGMWIWWVNVAVLNIIVYFYGQGASQHLH